MDNSPMYSGSSQFPLTGCSGIELEERAGRAAAQLNFSVSSTKSHTDLLAEFEIILSRFLGKPSVRIFEAADVAYARETATLATNGLRGTALFEEGTLNRLSLLGPQMSPELKELAICLGREEIEMLVSPQANGSEPVILIAVTTPQADRLTNSEIAALRQLSAIVERLYIRRRFALQLQQSTQLSRLASLAETTGHALRNPLSALESLSLILPTQWEDRLFLKELAEVMPQATQRVQQAVQPLLDACQSIQSHSQNLPIVPPENDAPL